MLPYSDSSIATLIITGLVIVKKIVSMALGFTETITEMDTKILLGKWRAADLKTDKLTAFCTPII
jgi:hypothetical protein